MNPVRFAQADKVFHAPPGMDNCCGIHAAVVQWAGGQTSVLTAWKPTPEELVRLNLGGAGVPVGLRGRDAAGGADGGEPAGGGYRRILEKVVDLFSNPVKLSLFGGDPEELKTATMNHKLDTNKVLTLARQHLGTNSSARACMADAVKAHDAGDLNLAARWALRSLAHSVGILHPDYTRAFHASGVGGEVRLVSAGGAL